MTNQTARDRLILIEGLKAAVMEKVPGCWEFCLVNNSLIVLKFLGKDFQHYLAEKEKLVLMGWRRYTVIDPFAMSMSVEDFENNLA